MKLKWLTHPNLSQHALSAYHLYMEEIWNASINESQSQFRLMISRKCSFQVLFNHNPECKKYNINLHANQNDGTWKPVIMPGWSRPWWSDSKQNLGRNYGQPCTIVPLACHSPLQQIYDDVIKWRHLPRNWPFFAGNSLVTGEFPSQRPVTRSFDVLFDPHLNKRLSEQSRGWWFETPSRSL